MTMFRESGRLPSTIMNMTPNEFRFLFIREVNPQFEEDKMLLTARGHIRHNPGRVMAGMLPKIVDELRVRMEGK